MTREAAERIAAAVHAVNEEVGGTSVRALSVTVGGRPSEFTGPGGTDEMQIASHVAAVQVQLHREPLRTLAATDLERAGARRWVTCRGPNG